MNQLIYVLSFLFSYALSAQNISLINRDIGISDSLSYEHEIRIYQNQGITNYSSLFRMYQREDNSWNAEFYEHFDGIEPKVIKKVLTPISEHDYIFQNFLRSFALEIPNSDTIKWKLATSREVILYLDTIRGVPERKYWSTMGQMTFVDGQSFSFQIKDLKDYNSFEYGNPSAYLNHFPEIDEIQYVNEILSIVRSEFDIWKTE